jgi:hypothetical protein
MNKKAIMANNIMIQNSKTQKMLACANLDYSIRMIVRAYKSNNSELMSEVLGQAEEDKSLRKLLCKLERGRTYMRYLIRCRHHNDDWTAFLLRLEDDRLIVSNTHDSISPRACSPRCSCGNGNLEIRALGPDSVDAFIFGWQSATAIFPSLLPDNELTIEFTETWIWAFLSSKIK